MGSWLVLCALVGATASAITNPIAVSSAVIVGNQTSKNFPDVTRDGGWESKIGNDWFQFYLDTETCDQTKTNGQCHGFAANTLALATSDPSVVQDVGEPDSSNNPSTVCNSEVKGYRFHFTNIVPIPGSSTQGVAWYANISSDTSHDIDGDVVGAGVGVITYSNGKPSCKVYDQFWGEDQPNWGDHSVITQSDGYTYLLGSFAAGSSSDIYLARVKTGSATNLKAYEYWNGSSFQSKALVNPDYKGYAPASIMQGIDTGTITYNEHYKMFMYIYPNGGTSGSISAIVASNLQGPWSSPTLLYHGPDAAYDTSPLTHFDTSGKTVTMTFAVFEETIPLKVLKVTFK